MNYDQTLVAGKLRRWEKYLREYRLPDWESIPDFGLYLDQTVEQLHRYLDFLPPELREEETVTAAAINNYVRRGFLPRPVSKRYYRTHIALLIMLCTLKRSLSISMLSRVIPTKADELTVRAAYAVFTDRYTMMAKFFVEQVRLSAASILALDSTTERAVSNTEDLITSSAIVAGFCTLLAEKLLLLEGKTRESGGPIEEIASE